MVAAFWDAQPSLAHRALRLGLLALCGAVMAIACLARFSVDAVWEDAYIGVRYADNSLKYGRISWDPGGEPVYGMTAPLHLVLLVPARALAPDAPALAAALSSLAGGLIWLALLVRFLTTLSAVPSSHARSVGFAFALLCPALSISRLADHFLSGMDTTLALAYLTAYFLLIHRHERSGSLMGGVLAGVFGGLAFFARPDLLVFTVAIPVVMMCVRGGRGTRRGAVPVLCATLAALVVGIGSAAWYFDSPLPLPAYVKATRFYGDAIYQSYAGVARLELRRYVLKYWYLFVLIAGSVCLRPLQWWRLSTSVDKGMLAGTLLFLGYHSLFVLPVMYYSQRFLYPTLPALIWLAARGFISLGGTEIGAAFAARPDASRRTLAASAIGFSLLLFRMGFAEWGTWSHRAQRGAFGQFDLASPAHAAIVNGVWPGLNEIAGLPDDMVIATTEVGHPSAGSPGKKIIDLAGLNNTDLAHKRLSPAEVIRRARPDLIYLPHPDYKEIRRSIEEDLMIGATYERVALRRPASLDVALLRGGPYYARLRDIVLGGGAR